MIAFLHGLSKVSLGSAALAQLAESGVDTPEEAALIFSGPQFFIALLSGLILTFGFHLLLTNLSVAAGMSYVGHSSPSKSSSDGKSGSSNRKIGVAFGLWTLITVSLALFVACLLAVKLSLYSSPLLGAITGLVIWGTYFCMLFWVSSTTVGSLIGSIVKTATSSFQTLVGTASTAIGARSAGNQLVETAEATAAAVRKEITAGWDGEDIKDTLQDYLSTVTSPSLDTQDLEAEFERLIRESDLDMLSDRDTLNQVDREMFEKLVSDRTDLSRQESRRIADRLYRRWRKSVGSMPANDPMAEIIDYLKTAQPAQLMSSELGDRLDQFLAEYRKRSSPQGKTFLKQGLSTLVATVLGRSDLSDLNAETVTQKLQQVRQQVENVVPDSQDRYSVVRTDVENYLLNIQSWQMQPQRMKAEFLDVIYDPEADPVIMRRELRPLNKADFSEILASRGLFTQSEIERVSSQLEEVRQQVLAELSERYRIKAAKDLQVQIYTFLQRAAREDLLSDAGTDTFRSLLEDPEATPEELGERFSPFGYEAFRQSLSARSDMSDEETQQVASRFERVMNAVQSDAEGLQSAAKARIENQQQALEDYLRRTGKTELDPDDIKADVKMLLHEPDEGMQRVRQRLARFDRTTLVKLLGQRNDLSEPEIDRILLKVESAWYQAVNAPAALTEKAKLKYDEATTALEDYLRNTGKPELNPTGIKRDLELLLSRPEIGLKAMQHRLSEVDRDTLVQLLSQRDDLSDTEVNQIIDDVLETIRDVLKFPQRAARRTKDKVLSFETAFEDYLRNTNRDSLNPEGIKRDLRILLSDPRLGADRLQTRVAQIDRDTVVALIAQRQDMSKEEAAAVVDRVMEVRNQIIAQIRNIQEQVKSMIRGILARVRNYLNSLGRPELNYYGIKRDLRQLFDDPQAGFESLRVRLGQIDRGTVIALLSSQEGISESDADGLVRQVEEVRDGALHRAEKLERAVENRLAELRHQAQERVEETRETAEAAAWWIFGTATISAISAAVAGSLAALG